ncbi:hypothetical protein HPB49_025885 [Dermacentor silvarum]|nr:hypothetical protein HPB49_025885 [Dermacentor silvarum]
MTRRLSLEFEIYAAYIRVKESDQRRLCTVRERRNLVQVSCLAQSWRSRACHLGRPSKLCEEANPDLAPTLLVGYKANNEGTACYERAARRWFKRTTPEVDAVTAAPARAFGVGATPPENRYDDDDEVTPVPVKDVARIIGKGGSRIRELRDSSGAHIWVKKDDADNYFETKIKLSDPEEACRKARELIDAIVHPSEEPACSSKSEEPPSLLDWDKLLAKSDEDAKKRWASLAPIIKNFRLWHCCCQPSFTSAASLFRGRRLPRSSRWWFPAGKMLKLRPCLLRRRWPSRQTTTM